MQGRPAIEALPAEIPPDDRKHHGAHQIHTGVIHVVGGDRRNRRQQEDDADEQGPQTGPGIHELAGAAQVPRPALELAEHQLAHDGDAVGDVERDGADVEDAGDGGVGAQPDQVDEDAEEDAEPDAGERRARARVHPRPGAGEGEEAVAREGEDGAGGGLHGGEADELDDDEATEGVEDAAGLAERVVVDLGYGLVDGRCEDVERVGAHAEAEHDVEEEAPDVGEDHGRGNRPGSFETGIADFFGNVRGGVVVGHGPGDGEEAEEEGEALGLPAGV